MLDSLINKLKQISLRYKEVESLLSLPDVTENQENFVALSKEYADLGPIISGYNRYVEIQESLAELNQLKNDSDNELRELAQSESEELENELKIIMLEIRQHLLPKDPDDSKDVYLEIRAGTGGDEAALFSGDLFRMYTRLAERNKWTIETINIRHGDHGGFKEIVAKIEGKDVYKKLKFESGVHRVQRVPVTESQGRVHTSACSVAVLPEMATLDAISIDKSDLRIDTFRASGAGGQHVNKTDSAVRLTHIPSGIVVECQDGRSQHKNKEKALQLLQSKLMELEKSKVDAEQAESRRLMVGSGDRSEKIRTYNYPQARITDHRIVTSVHNFEGFLDGDMESMISALLEEEQAMALAKLEEGS
ncbi:MAG: peptide chain release factor 1 [SAR86 cluster bacterium]|nr:peptide chain release factor 1 [SAR86 cluster bacterium]